MVCWVARVGRRSVLQHPSVVRRVKTLCGCREEGKSTICGRIQLRLTTKAGDNWNANNEIYFMCGLDTFPRNDGLKNKIGLLQANITMQCLMKCVPFTAAAHSQPNSASSVTRMGK
jgi:hypothetical protein